MDSIQVSTLVPLVAVIGFIYTYIKDRESTAKSLGRLEHRVESLEQANRILENLVNTLTETRIVVTRLEQKVDNISQHIERQQDWHNGGKD